MVPPSATGDLPPTYNKSQEAHMYTHAYDTTLTDRVVAATGPGAHPRLAQVMPALVRHLHDFAREVELTTAEWATAVEMINEAGRMSDDRRNETQLLCDILGLETLVDDITSVKLARGSAQQAAQLTPSGILGPFYREGAPLLPNGSSIVRGLTTSTPWYMEAVADSAFFTGRVLSAATGRPIDGAVVDVWLAAPNGLYEQQDPTQEEMNLRGRFTTDAQGRYAFYALRPTSYPIPADGPTGRLLGLLDRQPYRPGHVHFLVTAPGHSALVTQVFDERDRLARSGNGSRDADAVFAVKDALVVRFVERLADDRARWTLEYDFVLLANDAAAEGNCA